MPAVVSAPGKVCARSTAGTPPAPPGGAQQGAFAVGPVLPQRVRARRVARPAQWLTRARRRTSPGRRRAAR